MRIERYLSIQKSQIRTNPTWVAFTELHTMTVLHELFNGSGAPSLKNSSNVSTQTCAFYWLFYLIVWNFSLIIQVWKDNGIQEPDFWAFRSHCKWGRDLAEKNRNCLLLGICRPPQATMGIILSLSIQMYSKPEIFLKGKQVLVYVFPKFQLSRWWLAKAHNTWSFTWMLARHKESHMSVA